MYNPPFLCYRIKSLSQTVLEEQVQWNYVCPLCLPKIAFTLCSICLQLVSLMNKMVPISCFRLFQVETPLKFILLSHYVFMYFHEFYMHILFYQFEYNYCSTIPEIRVAPLISRTRLLQTFVLNTQGFVFKNVFPLWFPILFVDFPLRKVT